VLVRIRRCRLFRSRRGVDLSSGCGTGWALGTCRHAAPRANAAHQPLSHTSVRERSSLRTSARSVR